MSEESSNADEGREQGGTPTSRARAELIVDKLVRAGLIECRSFGRAVAVTAEEIDARKALGDY